MFEYFLDQSLCHNWLVQGPSRISLKHSTQQPPPPPNVFPTHSMSTGVLFGTLILSPLITVLQATLSWSTIRSIEALLKKRHEGFIKYYQGKHDSNMVAEAPSALEAETYDAIASPLPGLPSRNAVATEDLTLFAETWNMYSTQRNAGLEPSTVQAR
jgi:hypothetical protein